MPCGGNGGEAGDSQLSSPPLTQGSTPQLAGILAQVLHGEAPPGLGPLGMASPEDTRALVRLRGQLEPQWKMLQVAGETGSKVRPSAWGPGDRPGSELREERALGGEGFPSWNWHSPGDHAPLRSSCLSAGTLRLETGQGGSMYTEQ